MKTRRTFVASAAGALAFAPAVLRAQETTLKIGALVIDTTAEPFYAQELGLWQKVGLNVDIQTFPSGGATAAAVIGGAVDVGIIDAVSMASAHARGVPISYIAPAALHTAANPAYAVIVANDSPIRTAKDFAGKTVAVNGLKNILQIPLEGWIDNNGGDAKSVKFIEVPFPQMAPSIESRQIDAASTSEPFITSAVQSGKFRMIPVTQNGIAPTFAFSGWCVTNDWASKHADVVLKYVAVMAQTAKWANANRASSAPILVKVSKMPEALVSKLIRCQYGERLEARYFQPVFDAAAKYGLIEKSFPAKDVFHPAAL